MITPQRPRRAEMRTADLPPLGKCRILIPFTYKHRIRKLAFRRAERQNLRARKSYRRGGFSPHNDSKAKKAAHEDEKGEREDARAQRFNFPHPISESRGRDLVYSPAFMDYDMEINGMR